MKRLLVAAAVAVAACGAPKPEAPKKPQLPPLETTSLPAITQGPGARWVVLANPRALSTGPLAKAVAKVLPKEGLDRLAQKLGFDVRASGAALMVGFPATTFWAARLGDGESPSGAIESFEKRLLPPMGRSGPRPDLVRAWGSLAAGARGSIAGLWSSKGDVVAGESGRLGPVLATMALAAGKLAPARALGADPSFAPLLAWAKGADLAAIARCPIGRALGAAEGEENVLVSECFAAGLSIEPTQTGKAKLRVRVTGAWGKDQGAAADALRATWKHVAESDLGRLLGLDVAGTPEVVAAPDAVEATLAIDAVAVATGLRGVLDPDIEAATH